MLSSEVRSFAEPAEYAAAIRATKAEVLVTERGQFAAKRVLLCLHSLWMQRYEETLPRVAHSALVPGRAIITFRTAPGPSLLLGGVEIQPSSIVRLSEGHTFFHRSFGPVCFGSMSLPVEDLVSAGAAMSGCDLSPPSDGLTVIPPARAMARLQRLHAAAGHLAEDAPEVIANPEAARGLEQALIHALAACLAPGDGAEDPLARRRQAEILRRFRAKLEATASRALYVPELCAAIGVSDRTLRACCHDHLGMSPLRYLWLRRMHLARRALVLADPASTTVTAIAAAQGFWEFGRFAVTYRALFGEPPSTTLRRPPDGSQMPQFRTIDAGNAKSA